MINDDDDGDDLHHRDGVRHGDDDHDDGLNGDDGDGHGGGHDAMQSTMNSTLHVFFFICSPEGCRCTDEWRGETCEIPVDPNCQGFDCMYGTCTVAMEGSL